MAISKISRSFRRVTLRTPGSRIVMHYERRKPSKPKCSKCGAVLKGVPVGIPSRISRLPKTRRRPQRPYGGVLCSKCMRLSFVQKARSMVVKNG